MGFFDSIPNIFGIGTTLAGLGLRGQAAEQIRGFGRQGRPLYTFTPASEGGTGHGWSGPFVNELIDPLSESERLPFIEGINKAAVQDPTGTFFNLLGLRDAQQAQEYQIGRARETEGLFRQSKLPQISEEMLASGRKHVENPNVITQAEMDTIVGGMIGDVNDIFAERRKQTEGDISRRGLSPDAAAAIQAQLAAANIEQNVARVGDVAKFNASYIPTMIGLGEQERGQAGQLDTLYRQLIGEATAQEAGLHQPLPWSDFGQMASQRDLMQMLMETGDSAAIADALFNVGAGMFEVGNKPDYGTGSNTGALAMQGANVGIAGLDWLTGLFD